VKAIELKACDFTWVITRPLMDAKIWQKKLTNLGIDSVIFPCLEIVASHLTFLSAVKIGQMQGTDIFIITSPNSVRYLPENGLSVLRKYSAKIISIGLGTTLALNKNNIYPGFTAAQGISSEKLLELDRLQGNQVREKKILLLAGKGGRKLIQEQLHFRGAMVQKLELYQRVCPSKPNIESIYNLKNKLPLFVITSQAALINLLMMLPPNYHDWLKQQHFMVVSQRLKEFAEQQKFYSVVNASSTALEDLVSQFS